MTQRQRILTVLALITGFGILLVAVRPLLIEREYPGHLRAAFDAEFHTRPDGYPALAEHYGLRFPETPRQMDSGLMYRAVADGAVDVINGFATDGRIRAYDLMVLEDDRGFFPSYDAAPLVRRDTLERFPQIDDVLNQLAGRISTTRMQELNFEVDERGRRAREVAREFLTEEGLLSAHEALTREPVGRVVVGGKDFTEQQVIGEMLAILLEAQAGLHVDRKLNLGGTMICFEALRAGDIDLYAEYTGTALVSILNREVIADPDESYRVVAHAFDAQYDLMWLKPFGFNNTYTLTMRRTEAHRLEIHTISDLAGYIAVHGDCPDLRGAAKQE